MPLAGWGVCAVSLDDCTSAAAFVGQPYCIAIREPHSTGCSVLNRYQSRQSHPPLGTNDSFFSICTASRRSAIQIEKSARLLPKMSIQYRAPAGIGLRFSSKVGQL